MGARSVALEPECAKRGEWLARRTQMLQLRYMGFQQTKAVRVYRFDGVIEHAPTVHYAVAVNLELFLKHRVGIQEGPTLCARKLASDLEAPLEGEHTLTNDDLLAYVAAKQAVEARKAASRRPVGRRGSLHVTAESQPQT